MILQDGNDALESGKENESVHPPLERQTSIVIDARIDEIREALKEEAVPGAIVGFEKRHDLNKRVETAKRQGA